ncbi:hypothetical protein NE237_028900 [Protea cynaroides]|uniref:Uncharacterized protein n=1 Tax=Protea cynaroides TaxID=273540 RepID=A0A9Q0JVQ4_9MAGN|nr:hypothetical protein NE237_028900 [Protea cynaroides]
MSSLLPLLLLCLTINACKARHLSVIDKGPSKQVQLSVKEVEKERSMKTSIGLEVMSSKSDELQTGQEGAANAESIIIEGRGGASTQRPKHSGVGSIKVKKKKKKKKTGKAGMEWTMEK